MITQLYCDGAFNKDSGKYAWCTVVDAKGNDMLKDYTIAKDHDEYKKKVVKGKTVLEVSFDGVQHQNNGAELIAFIIACSIALKNNINDDIIFDDEVYVDKIYCDSELITKWWSVGHYNAKNLDQKKIGFIKIAAELRKKCEERGIQIIKIKGSENKADLGYHKN